MAEQYKPESNSFDEALTLLYNTVSGQKLADTPYNRRVVNDAKFWIGVEMMRFTYNRRDLEALLRACNSIEWV